MQNSLDKLKSIDSKIKIIDNMIKAERYYGSGITLSLGIGPHEYHKGDGRDNITVEIPCAEYIETILATMKHSLEESRKFYLSDLRRTIKEAINLGYYDDEH